MFHDNQDFNRLKHKKRIHQAKHRSKVKRRKRWEKYESYQQRMEDFVMGRRKDCPEEHGAK